MNISDKLIPNILFSPNYIKSPDSWVGHLPFTRFIVEETKPKLFVELGTHSGNSYFSFCQSVQELGLVTKCYAIDTWKGDEHAGHYGDEVFHQVYHYHHENFSSFSKLLRMSFDEGLAYFSDNSINLLHIDGLHTYEAVRHDFESWLPKLSPGAVVIFHDTMVRERNFGVWKFWEELQSKYPNNLNFLHSHGLGVIQLDNTPKNQELEWLQPNHESQKQIIDFFSSLGTYQLEKFNLATLRAQLNSTQAELNSTQADLNSTQADLNSTQADLNSTQADLNSTQADLNSTQAELGSIKNSTPWKIIRRLRKIHYLFLKPLTFFNKKFLTKHA